MILNNKKKNETSDLIIKINECVIERVTSFKYFDNRHAENERECKLYMQKSSAENWFPLLATN